jgi:hypothetical protein
MVQGPKPILDVDNADCDKDQQNQYHHRDKPEQVADDEFHDPSSYRPPNRGAMSGVSSRLSASATPM